MARYPSISGAQSAQIIGNLNQRALDARSEKKRSKDARFAQLIAALNATGNLAQAGGSIYGVVGGLEHKGAELAQNREIETGRQDIDRLRIAEEVAEATKDRQFKETKQFPHEERQAKIIHEQKLTKLPEAVIESRATPITKARESGLLSSEEEAQELEAVMQGKTTPRQIGISRLQNTTFPGNNDLRPEVLGTMKRDDLAHAFARVMSRIPIQDQDEVVLELARRIALGGQGRQFPTEEDFKGIEADILAINPQEKMMSPAVAQAMGPYGNPAAMAAMAEQDRQKKQALQEVMLRILELQNQGMPEAVGPQKPLGEISPETLKRLGISPAR
jgi:hypothetical protein